MQLGNGYWETARYTPDRLQVDKIGLGRTDSTQDLLKLEFEYKTDDPNVKDNNGSMREQKITVPTVGTNPGFTAIQTYTYDNLNRLKVAEETISGPSWKQTFDYDIYGNREIDAANTTTLGSCPTAVCDPEIGTGKNQIITSGYLYDAAGSLTQDAAGQRFDYDAENRQKSFFAASNGTSTPSATYAYDGEGRRVRKVGGDENIIFVYDAAGRLAAEYNAGEAIFTEEIPRVSYLTNDHLGSPRIVTDANGGVVSRKDFAAFGDETITSHRTPALGYPVSGPDIRHDYTGYQKDSESGLDFAQARYYNSQHGRFTSIDPLTASATIKDPQSFNRYSYVTNSPYKFVDPLGLALQDIGVYQTNSAFEAQRAEHQTIRDQQLTINRQYQESQNRSRALYRLETGGWKPGVGLTQAGGEIAAIGTALVNMIKKRNSTAKRIASNIVNSDITIDVTNAATAFTTTISPTNLASAIKGGNVSFQDAMGYLKIAIPQGEFTNSVSPPAAIESTLVHEGTHAESMATAIVSASIGGNFDRSMIVDEYQAKVNAAQYEVDKGGVYRQHGQASLTSNHITPGQGLINNAGQVNIPLIQSIANGEPGTVRSRLGIK